MDRRAFLALGAGAGATASVWALRLRDGDDGSTPTTTHTTTVTSTTVAPTTTTTYGSLLEADSLGLELPPGFSARLVATSGKPVADSSHRWHVAPDGGACFDHPDGGWVYVSNSEALFGGAGVLRFTPDGKLVTGYSILSGTTGNCAGGATPWGTWLSCEEHPGGQVWECDPLGRAEAAARPAMGRFTHEAAACDPDGKQVYLTEDARQGKLRRFRPDTWGDLSAGTLEVAVVEGLTVTWTSDTDAGSAFDGGEGAWYAAGRLWFTSKGDNRVWELDVRAAPNQLTVLYDPDAAPNPVLSGADNIVGTQSGDLFVAEDGGNMELVRISPSGEVSPFLRLLDQSKSEITGPAFSPDGTRLYFSSQRGKTGAGLTYEVRGPFNS